MSLHLRHDSILLGLMSSIINILIAIIDRMPTRSTQTKSTKSPSKKEVKSQSKKSTAKRSAKKSDRKSERKRYESIENVMKNYNIKTISHAHNLSLKNVKTISKELGSDKKMTPKNIIQTIPAKMCSCVKKVKNIPNESIRIAICNKSIVKNRNLKISKLQCNPKPLLIPKKGSKLMIQSAH